MIIPKGINITILRGPLKGFKWISGAAAGPFKGLSVILNLSETKQITLAKKLTPKNGISFDIGANVGLYTILFSRYSRKVFAFEPLTRNINYLQKIIEINNIKNVKVLKVAVSDIKGKALFKRGRNYAEGKLDNNGDLIVSTISLDDFIYKNKIFPNIIKIDVEGSELSVIKGASNYLKNFRPIILLSTHNEVIKRYCIKYLKELNYKNIIPLNSRTIKHTNEFILT